MRIFLASAIWLCSIAATPMYGVVPQSRARVGLFSNGELAKMVKDLAKGEGVMIHAGSAEALPSWPKGGGVPLKKLDRPSLAALYTALRLKLPDGDLEMDLLVEVDGALHPVTVWRDGPSMSVVSGPPVPQPPVLDAAAFEERWPRFPLEEVDAKWTPELLGAIDASLSRLPEADLARLEGVSFRRRPARERRPDLGSVWRPPAGAKASSGFSVLAATYVHDEGSRRIEVYNQALSADDTVFIGSVEAPSPALHRVLVHELAHAVALGPAPEAGRWSPLARAYEHQRAGRPGPTSYGASSPEEGLAEAYSLWLLDADALERVQPEVLAWLRDGHALLEEDRRVGVEPPEAVGETAGSSESPEASETASAADPD